MAFVPLKETRIVGVVSLVDPPVDKVPVMGNISSVTKVMVGALGAFISTIEVSTVVVKLLEALLTLPAISITLALNE